MKKMKNMSRKALVIVLATIIMLLPNVRAYSSVGEYASTSLAISASNEYPTNPDTAKVAVPAVVGAVLLGAVLVGVFVAGLLDGWAACGASKVFKTRAVFYQSLASKYDPHDFAKFDI